MKLVKPGRWQVRLLPVPVFAIRTRTRPTVWELQHADGTLAFGDGFESLAHLKAHLERNSPMSTTKKLIGHFGVDSGQFVIMDPAYIAYWKDREFQDIRRYQNKNGRVLQYLIDFDHYDQPIQSENGQSMNELLGAGAYTKVENPPPKAYGLDYHSACLRTISPPWGGELGNSMAVACRTAHGDGKFPVYRIEDENGNLLRVEISFEEDGE